MGANYILLRIGSPLKYIAYVTPLPHWGEGRGEGIYFFKALPYDKVMARYLQLIRGAKAHVRHVFRASYYNTK